MHGPHNLLGGRVRAGYLAPDRARTRPLISRERSQTVLGRCLSSGLHGTGTCRSGLPRYNLGCRAQRAGECMWAHRYSVAT